MGETATVDLVCLLSLVFWLNETYQVNQIDQTDRTDERDRRTIPLPKWYCGNWHVSIPTGHMLRYVIVCIRV
jgi:hypothetical protein